MKHHSPSILLSTLALCAGMQLSAAVYTYDAQTADWFNPSAPAPAWTEVTNNASFFGFAPERNQIRVANTNPNWRVPQTSYAGAGWTAPEGEVITAVDIEFNGVYGINGAPQLTVYGGRNQPALRLFASDLSGDLRNSPQTALVRSEPAENIRTIEVRNWQCLQTAVAQPAWYSRVSRVTITTEALSQPTATVGGAGGSAGQATAPQPRKLSDGEPFIVNRFVFAHGAPYRMPSWEQKDRWYEFRIDNNLPNRSEAALFVLEDETVDITVPEAGKAWKAGYTFGPRKVYEGDRIGIAYAAEGLEGDEVRFDLILREGVPHGFRRNHRAGVNLGAATVADERTHAPAGFSFAEFVVGKEHDGLYLNELVTSVSPGSAGKNTLRLHSLQIERDRVDNRIDADAILATPPVNDARLALHNGVINVMLNGEPVNFMGYEAMLPQQFGNYDAMLNQGGFPVTRLGIVLGEDVYLRFHAPTWVGPTQYDFSWLDQEMARLLALKPENKVVLAIIFDGADWWTTIHPESSGIHAHTIHATGQHGSVAADRGDSAGYSYPGIPDYLSPQWQQDAREAVRQMVAHIQSSDYGHAVIGYELFGGLTMDCNFEVNDKTPAALERFRDMLREQYGTDAALRQAWGRPDVTFATAMPEHLVTEANPMASLRTPLIPDLAGRQAYLDSKRFREISFQQIIENFGKWIKEATRGQALVGARTGNFMGHLWSWGQKQEMRENRNNPIDLLSKSPYFDFFDVQEPYVGRHNLGFQGTGHPISAVRGLELDGKLLMIQDDVPHEVTPASRRTDETYMQGIKRRIFVNTIVNGTIPYQWEMGHYKFAHRYLLDEFRKHQGVAEKAVKLPRDSEAQVVFVYDRGWQKYLGVDDLQDRPTRMISFMDHAKWTWDRMGAPADAVFLDQLPELKPYRLYIFFNTFGITPEQAQIINDVVKKDNRVALFVWADAYSTPQGHNDAWMSEVIGIDIKGSDTSRTWNMTPTKAFSGSQPVSADFPLGVLPRTAPGEPNAQNWSYAPSFTVEDSSAIALAYYTGSREVALAQRNYREWKSIYSASAILSPSLLRYAATEAGVRLWTDTEDALYVNHSFIGLHAKDSGSVRLSLPEPSVLYEVFTDEELPASASHTLKTTADDTYLYFRGSRAQWQSIGQ